jgi:cell division protein FtsN
MNKCAREEIANLVDRVAPPAESPSIEPSDGAKGEKEKYDQAAKEPRKPTPTELLKEALNEHIETTKQENSRHLEKLAAATDDLAKLRPRYAALLQASRTNSMVEIISLVLMTLGGSVLGAAYSPVIPQPYSDYAFAGGLIGLICSAGILLWVKAMCWPKHYATEAWE